MGSEGKEPGFIRHGSVSIYVNKELQRADKHILDALDDKDVLFRFPEQGENNRSVLILKKPKTRTSVRKVSLTATVANMLIDWKPFIPDTPRSPERLRKLPLWNSRPSST